MFDYLVFIGRFQPFHLAHLAVIEAAFEHSHRVIVMLGSAQPERTLKNIFSAAEREQMIRAAFDQAQQSRLCFAGLIDLYDDKKWTAQVKQAVVNIVHDQTAKVGLIGHFKDQSSYYLALFPEWSLVELDNFFHLSATPLRQNYLLGQLPSLHEVPQSTLDFLMDFQSTPIYKDLQIQAQSAKT